MLRFLLIGGVNTLFGYSVYALLLFTGMHYVEATFVATVAGVIFNYFTTGGLVFGHMSGSALVRFILAYALVYVVNVSCIGLLRHVGVNVYFGGLILILPMAALTFLLMSRFVFGIRHIPRPNRRMRRFRSRALRWLQRFLGHSFALRPCSSVLKTFLRSDALLAMSTRAVQGAALSLSAVLVILHLSATDQGFYFAFISFGILLQLCDFGLSYASLQAASDLLATGRTDRLPELTRHALRINLIGTVVAAVAVVALGAWTFASADSTTAWLRPWLVFVSGVACNHLTAPSIFIVEGGVSVTRAWQLRLLQEVVAGIALLVVLAVGDGLWSLAAYYWARAAIATWWLRRFARPLLAVGLRTPTGRHWLQEMWPFQWRVGVGAISNFLVFQAFGPILFALRGPAEAGRFSLSLAVMNAIVMVTTAWPVSQAAHFGVMLGRQDAARLRSHWKSTLIGSTLFAAVCAVAAILFLASLLHWQPALSMRFAGRVATALLIISAVSHHAVSCFAVVVRAERHDPLMMIGIVGGVATVLLMTIAAASDAPNVPNVVAVVYFACTTATVLLAYRVYRRFARRRFVATA